MTRVYNSKPIPLHATDEEEAIIRARADERVKTPEPRYSVRRFVFGGMTVMAAAAIVWPSIPRIYESTVTLVLRPTNMEGQNDVSEASRHRPTACSTATASPTPPRARRRNCAKTSGTAW